MKPLDHYLEKIGIISYFTLDLSLNAYNFASKLGTVTSYSTIGFFSDFEDIFTTYHQTKIKGMVTDKQFKIKHKSSMFDFGKHAAVVTGFIQSSTNGITVSVKIDSFKIIIFVYMILACLYSCFAILSIIFTALFDSMWVLLTLPIILVFLVITVFVPYLLLRNSTRSMMLFFKNQFHYFDQQKVQESQTNYLKNIQ